MVDFKPASNAKGNVGVTLGAIGTGLGLLNGGLGGIFGGGCRDGYGYDRGRRDCYDGYDDCGGGKYRHKVSEHELDLVQENNRLLAQISTLQSEKYTDARFAQQSDRICELEKEVAVYKAHSQDFARYADREYVHQPKAHINESLLVSRHNGCNCGCGCGHHHSNGDTQNP